MCWCKNGWGSTDCSDTTPESYDIEQVNSEQYEDMVGRYIMVPMYLQENPADPQNIKFIHYDPVSSGWAISRLNSSCTDDICFFAYSKGQPIPPPKGYVYGQPNKHVYYKQMVFDDAELYPGRQAGYYMAVVYSPDPNTVDLNPNNEYLSEFVGRYVLQPRFVHQASGKYSIFPVSLNSPGKVWFMTGLEGEGPSRRWKVLASVTDQSLNRYTVPAGPWLPEAAAFEIKPSCMNHVSDDACDDLEEHCQSEDPDRSWVRACCRDTCETCPMPASSCALPNTALGGMQLLAKYNKTLSKTKLSLRQHGILKSRIKTPTKK